MSFFNMRQHVATKAASALPGRVQNSAVANTVLAPVLANQAPWLITPYLGLRARLSQVWINRWTILLILCLVRTLIAIASMHDGVHSARREALSACTGVEAAGSAMASMPHYMAQGTNELTAAGVERAINGLMSMLTLSVTGVEEIVVFVINLLTSTYVCLLTFVIRGSLHAAIALIEDVSGFLNKTLGDIGDGIQDGIDDFEKGLNGIVSGLNDVGNFFGSNDEIPKLNLDDQIDALHNLQLPSDLNADLEKLNASIPTFAQVNNFTNNAIRWPFEQIKDLIRENGPKYTFDRSVFPVPAKEKLTFCSDDNGINSFFDDLVELLFKARKISIAVLLILALLVMIPMAWRESRRYKTIVQRSSMMNHGHEPMDVVYLASRPSTSTVGLKLANGFEATRRQALIRWAIAYATTMPALFVLSLGVAGLFACLCRYIILQSVTKEVPGLVHQVEGFADKVVFSLNNASTAWANGTNTMILDMNGRINNDVFGWVNISTHAINDTLNTFVDTSIDVLNSTFGGTILYDPVTELFNCLIGLKVAGIQKGMTWISDNAQVNFPLLPNNTFSLGAAASLASDSGSTSKDTSSSFLADPSNGTSDAITGAVRSLVEHIENSIRTEAIISACVIGVWVLVALIGVIRALTLFYGKGDVSTTHSTPSFYSSDAFPPAESRQPTFPAVGIMREKQAMSDAIGEKTSPMQDPFADPVRGYAPPPAVKVQPPTASSSPTATANGGNSYRGNAYTIDPRPFPSFRTSPEPPAENAAISLVSINESEARTGSVKSLGVSQAIKRPGNQRQSSYGEVRAPVGSTGAPNRSVTFDQLGH